MEIPGVGGGGELVQLNCGVDLVAGTLEAERNAATAGEEVKNTQRLPGSEALNLAGDYALWRPLPACWLRLLLHPSPYSGIA